MRFIQTAVFHHHTSRTLIQNRAQHPTRRATRAEQQYFFTLQSHAQIVRDVAHQTHTIGVVAVSLTIIFECQGIHRTSPTRSIAQDIRIRKRIQFKRHSHVTTLQTLRTQFIHHRRKTFHRREHALITQCDTALRSKLRMNIGGFAVGNWVANHSVKF